MKNALIVSIMLLMSSQSFAWIEKAPQQKSYDFKFKLKTETFSYSRMAASYEDAYETAAQACFKHFKGEKRLSEDEGLDIIDVCANPRS